MNLLNPQLGPLDLPLAQLKPWLEHLNLLLEQVALLSPQLVLNLQAKGLNLLLGSLSPPLGLMRLSLERLEPRHLNLRLLPPGLSYQTHP